MALGLSPTNLRILVSNFLEKLYFLAEYWYISLLNTCIGLELKKTR